MNEQFENLKNYIRQHLQSGYPAESIASQLRAAGWEDALIQQGFQALQAETMSPQAIEPVPNNSGQYNANVANASTLSSPSQHNAPAQQKASLNPITHLVNGIRHLFKANPIITLILIVSAAIVNTIGTFLLTMTFISSVFAVAFSGAQALWKLFAIIAVILTIYMAIIGFVALVLNRMIYSNARNQKTSIGQLLRFCRQRYPLAIRAFLLLLVTYLAGYAIVLGVQLAVPALGIVLSLVGILVTIILAFRFSFISIVVIDDTAPVGVMSALRQSVRTWQRSAGAIILYWIMIIAFSVVAELFPSSRGWLPVRTPLLFGHSYWGMLPSFILPAIVGTLLGSIALAGFVDIYNQTVPAVHQDLASSQ